LYAVRIFSGLRASPINVHAVEFAVECCAEKPSVLLIANNAEKNSYSKRADLRFIAAGTAYMLITPDLTIVTGVAIEPRRVNGAGRNLMYQSVIVGSVTADSVHKLVGDLER
jgi:hypothetical protein